LVHALKLHLFREPLFQFLLLGAALFALFGIFGKKNEAEAPAKIVISAQRVGTLADGFARTWRRPPTEQELKGLVDDYIRDEVFYREGRAAGLDRDDVIIRRRVRQKMEFLAEDMAAVEPTEEQLTAYLASHPERFRTDERLTFHHVFLSATRRGSAMENDSKELASTLVRAGATENAAALGDPFLLGEEFRSLSQGDVARTFGDAFVKQISAVEPGRWQGPIPSSFGLHFVFVDERTPGSQPPLDTIRQSVQTEWLNERRLEAEQALYRKLRDHYEIVVESPAKAALSEAKP
jgi:PPIC-type PPIASE domain